MCAVALAVLAPSAHADIYTWVDNKGSTNVSNLPPPEGTRVTNVSRTSPKEAVREAAARETARQAEMRALNERVQQLQAEVEKARNSPPIAVAYAAPPVSYAAPAAAPYIINVMPSPAAPASGGCDYTWGDCGFGAWPGYYGSTVVVGRGKHLRRGGAITPGQTSIVPPLLPLPPPPRMPAPHPPRPR